MYQYPTKCLYKDSTANKLGNIKQLYSLFSSSSVLCHMYVCCVPAMYFLQQYQISLHLCVYTHKKKYKEILRSSVTEKANSFLTAMICYDNSHSLTISCFCILINIVLYFAPHSGLVYENNIIIILVPCDFNIYAVQCHLHSLVTTWQSDKQAGN